MHEDARLIAGWLDTGPLLRGRSLALDDPASPNPRRVHGAPVECRPRTGAKSGGQAAFAEADELSAGGSAHVGLRVSRLAINDPAGARRETVILRLAALRSLHPAELPALVAARSAFTAEATVAYDGPAQQVEIFCQTQELCGRSLHDTLTAGLHPGSVPDRARAAALSLLPVARTLAFLERTYGIVHRDIAPDNVLVAADGTLRIIDFGYALVFDDRTSIRTALPYKADRMAPEVELGEQVTRAIDVWLLGYLLWECCARGPGRDGPVSPFLKPQDRHHPGPTNPRVNELPAGLQRLVRGMLAPRPRDRPSMQDVADGLASWTADRDGTAARSAERAVRHPARTPTRVDRPTPRRRASARWLLLLPLVAVPAFGADVLRAAQEASARIDEAIAGSPSGAGTAAPCPAEVAAWLPDDGTGATVLGRYETDEHFVTICAAADGSAHYDGQSKDGAEEGHISLPAEHTDRGYVARNGEYAYAVEDGRLVVRHVDDVLLDAALREAAATTAP